MWGVGLEAYGVDVCEVVWTCFAYCSDAECDARYNEWASWVFFWQLVRQTLCVRVVRYVPRVTWMNQ